MNVPTKKNFLEYYGSQHQTWGCRIFHVLGFLLVALQIVHALIYPALYWLMLTCICETIKDLAVFACIFMPAISGIVLLILGHLLFEKNLPAIVTFWRKNG